VAQVPAVAHAPPTSAHTTGFSFAPTPTSDTTKKKRATDGTIVCNGGCGAFISGASVLRCSRCKLARYCGQRCQRAHWKTHKLTCKAVDAKKGLPTKKTGKKRNPAPPVGGNLEAGSACALCFEEMIDPILAIQCDNQLGVQCVALSLIHSPPSFTLLPHSPPSLLKHSPSLMHFLSHTYSPSLMHFQPISIAAVVCRYHHFHTRRLRTCTPHTPPPTHTHTLIHDHIPGDASVEQTLPTLSTCSVEMVPRPRRSSDSCRCGRTAG
jgi:hypothetical protein